jgi:hypothetical protein
VIQPIVEGHGEVKAIPVLLRRLLAQAEIYNLRVGNPIRCKRSQLAQKDKVRQAVRLARLQKDCRAILILFDSDDDCPKELAPRVEKWAEEEAGDVPCCVVMVHREYEAWFLASIPSLRGERGIREDAEPYHEPERPRNAKKHLEQRMRRGFSYSETADQAALTAQFDLAVAYAQCRSFRKMTSAFGQLLESAGTEIDEWPPSSWRSSDQQT